jgi:TolB-like protein
VDEPVLSFGRWRLLPGSRRLFAGDVPIPLGSRAFDLLLALVEARGALVTKDELLRRVWPGTVVEENNLQVQVAVLRKVFGEDGLIATIPGRGYRFTGAAQLPDADAAPVARPSVAPGAFAPPGDAPQSSRRPMLVVLPFANMTGDPEQEYFADGITEDLTTALSHLRWFAVIARNSAFTYKGRAVDVRQVGRELGVGYVLAGSVRKAGSRVRIGAQLCEAGGGRHVWAERFDGDLTDIFDLQDRVTEAVAGAIEPSLRLAEVERARSRPTENLTAYDLYLRALPPQRLAAREGNDEALRLLRRAIALDPGFVAAKGALAGVVAFRFTQTWATQDDVDEAVRLAREVAEGGGEDDPSALAWAGHALAFLARDRDAGLAATDRALAFAPNSALVLFLGGWNRLYVDDWRTAAAQMELAMRLSPVDPAKFYYGAALGAAHFVGERYGEAVEWERRALRDRPTYLVAHRLLAASLIHLGHPEAAREAMRALLAVAPGYTLAAAAAHSAFRGRTRERYLSALRLAGLPED